MIGRALVRLAAAPLAPTAWAFRAALAEPAATQARLKRRLARGVAATAYGREHGLRDAADWEALPVVGWEDLAPWVARQQAEAGPVLAPDPVLFYETTSGSTGAKKAVPYTAALRGAFTRMFRVWAHDLVTRGPGFETGRTYFQVSPRLEAITSTARGVPVGTRDDRDFLGGWTRALLAPFLVAPRRMPSQAEAFLDELTQTLLRAPGLEVISVWSPSFLKVVMDYAVAHHDRLFGTCKDGAAVARLRHLRDPAPDWTRVWPRLKLISCWDQGEAARPAAWLRGRFPGVLVQGKGLLATEGPVTVPLLGAPGPVPLLTEVLIELEDGAGRVRPLAEAEDGAAYGLVLSQPAGLSRYRIGDRVRARGRVGATPCLEFIGRGESVSDMVGEKLNAAFVRGALAGLELEPAFTRTLVARRGDAGSRPRYELWLDALPGDPPPGSPAERVVRERLLRRLEEALAAAYHYRQARLLGQLAPAALVVHPGAADGLARLLEGAGVRRGDQKPRSLAGPVDGRDDAPGGRDPGNSRPL